MFKKGTYVIVRTYSAGVHCGKLAVYDATVRHAILEETRRVWSWDEANTLSEIAQTGLGAKSNVSVEIKAIMVGEVVEIIPCTAEGEASIRAAVWSGS